MHPRILVSLIAIITSVFIAYLGIWLGLGGAAGALSPANTQFAQIAGAIYALLLVIVVNVFPFNNAKKPTQRSWWIIAAAHLIIGTALTIFVIMGAAV